VKGRGFFLAGLVACLLGPLLIFVQFGLKWLFVPWYSAVLASLGAVLVLVSVIQRPGLMRVAALLFVAAFAAFQWYFHGWMMKLPEYAGPAQAGKQLPAFTAVQANGEPFTDTTLTDGTRRAFVFFRGRW